MVKIVAAHQITNDIDAYFSQFVQKPAASDLPLRDAESTRQGSPIAVSRNLAVLTEGDSMEVDRTSLASKRPLETDTIGLGDGFTVVSKSCKTKNSTSARGSNEPQKGLKSNPRTPKF